MACKECGFEINLHWQEIMDDKIVKCKFCTENLTRVFWQTIFSQRQNGESGIHKDDYNITGQGV